jgi:hypothetical protein
LSCPAVTGYDRWATGVRGKCVATVLGLSDLAAVLPKCGFDAEAGGPLLSVDALRVDPCEDVDAVSGPLGYLRCWYPSVQTERHCGVPQVVRSAG